MMFQPAPALQHQFLSYCSPRLPEDSNC
jgi:hypothetical protein